MPGFPPGVHLIGGRNAAPVNAQLAREFYTPILPLVAELHRQGLSLRAIARELDRRGIKTRPEWDRWSATQVRRVLARYRDEAGRSPDTVAATVGADLCARKKEPSEEPPRHPVDCPAASGRCLSLVVHGASPDNIGEQQENVATERGRADQLAHGPVVTP
jgi:hypothetical protein